jgi:Mn-dependent DtxR family transcriptional regulator
MKNLREREFITVSDSGFINLTEKGLELASTIYERHTLLSSWLMKLGVSEETALSDACKLEHVISQESFDAIKKHVGSR